MVKSSGTNNDSISTSVAQSAPADVIREIFKYFACPFLVTLGGRCPGFPWYLGHVCSAWRKMFLSMSTEFWSTFLRSASWDSHRESVNDAVVMAKAFLEYNQGQLFSFDVQAWSETPEVLQVFIPESARWLDVAISLKKTDVSILAAVRNRTPHLRSLDLNIKSVWRHKNLQPFRDWDFFGTSPNLTYVKMNAIPEWQFGWSNLTTLVLTRVVEDWFLRVLPELHKLEKLVIPMLGETLRDYANAAIMILPLLKVLRTLMPSILSVLQAPSLEELYIVDAELLGESDLVCTSFLDRSACSLHHLYMGNFSPWTVSEMLKRSPDIKTLSIRAAGGGPHRYRYHYELLTCRPDMPSLASQLHTLQMVFPYDSTNDIVGFTTMLASRTTERLPSVGQLQQITCVMNARTPMPTEFEQICDDHGVKFNFIFYDCWYIKGKNISWDLGGDEIKWST